MDAQTSKPTDEELKNIKLFDQVSLEEIREYTRDCQIRELTEGEILMEEGQVDDHLYFILSGSLRIQLQKNSLHDVSILDCGESIGEISTIDQQPCSGFVITNEATRLLVVDETTLWRIVQQSHSVAYNLLKTLAHRMRFGSSVMYRIQNMLKKYEHEATIDPLTGFYNRRWLSKTLSRLVQRTFSGGESLSVIMMDLDHFKKFNDCHGHVAGDYALSTIARALTEHLRPEDSIARYGGEEFIAVLPGSDLQDAVLVAERLRHKVENTKIVTLDGKQLGSLTLSLGVAEMGSSSLPDSLINAADCALYMAKNNGRNQVAIQTDDDLGFKQG